MSRLTAENVEQMNTNIVHPRMNRRISLKDNTDMVTGPSMRRMSRMWEGRPSIQYGSSGRRLSIMSKTSTSGASYGMKHSLNQIRIANTYRLEPEPEDKFSASKVKSVMERVMLNYLDEKRYDSNMGPAFAQTLSEMIKSQVKELGYPRYKIVSHVLIGQNASQDLQMTSRCLWHADTDNSATLSFAKNNLFAVATVFATYYE